MIISVVNKKGGVGKTPFAFSVAKDLEYFLQSNDNSIIEKIYPEKAKILPTPKKIDNCVYDFGEFVLSNTKQKEPMIRELFHNFIGSAS
ncbi:hypothetical protein DPU37_07905 [Campylobacter coli]|nr:hypothetical protein [Campylobacter coli]